jgi:uncharacterized membrane protein YtjA (UPF0391 family)
VIVILFSAIKKFLWYSEEPLISTQEESMLWYTIVFLIIAIIAAIFGFGGISDAAAGIAKVLFFIFVVLFVISLIFGRRGAV